MKKYNIIEVHGGIGKNIMATAVIKNIKHKYPDRDILVITGYPEVYLSNPYIYRVFRFGNCPYLYNDYVKGQDVLFFCSEPYRSNGYLKQDKHLIESWSEELNVPFVYKTGELFINPLEVQSMANRIIANKPILLFQPFGGMDGNMSYNWNRDIPPKQAQIIADILSEKYHIVQVGNPNRIKLNNCEFINCPLRDLFALTIFSEKVLGIDSSIQHIAACFNRSATVCWITNTPKVFGYDVHKNIFPKKDQYISEDIQSIDGYFHQYDFSGSRNYDYPFRSNDIFSVTDIVESMNTVVPAPVVEKQEENVVISQVLKSNA